MSSIAQTYFVLLTDKTESMIKKNPVPSKTQSHSVYQEERLHII